MKSIILLTAKNLKLLVRAKASALIIIFAPLLLILLLGLTYNTNEQFGLDIGVYAPEFSSDVEEFIALLEEESFTITRFDNVETCVDTIKSNDLHTCIELPANLQIESNVQKEVTYHIDPSRINLVWMIQNTVQSKFNIKSQEISQDLAQNIVATLSDINTDLDASKQQVAQVREKVTFATDSTGAAKARLSSTQVDIPAATYNQEEATTIQDNVNGAIGDVEKTIGIVENSTIDATTKEEILDELTDAKAKLEGADETDLGGTIAAILSDVALLRERLTSATSAVSASDGELGTATSRLEETHTILSNLESGLTSVQGRISGQQVTDAGTITSPIVTRIEKVSDEGTYLNYSFPALLILVIMFSSLLLGTSLVMMEKNSPAFMRNFFMPVRKISFLVSIYLTNLVLNIVQVLIVLGISLIFLKDTVSSLPAVALILLITASVFTFFGMVVGSLFSSEETAILASVSLGSIHLFLSGVILPLEGISSTLRAIVSFNPFVVAESLIREIFIFSSPISSIWVELSILLGYAVILFFVVLIIETIIHKHLMHMVMRYHHRKHRKKGGK